MGFEPTTLFLAETRSIQTELRGHRVHTVCPFHQSIKPTAVYRGAGTQECMLVLKTDFQYEVRGLIWVCERHNPEKSCERHNPEKSAQTIEVKRVRFSLLGKECVSD